MPETKHQRKLKTSVESCQVSKILYLYSTLKRDSKTYQNKLGKDFSHKRLIEIYQSQTMWRSNVRGQYF